MKQILIILSLLLSAAIGFSQESTAITKSIYSIEKKNPVEILLPGAGTLKGTIHIADKKTVLPLAFIDIEKGKQLQADTKGYFELEMDTGSYDIRISSVGYKDLLIKDFRVIWGTEITIKVSMAIEEGFRKN